jgi:hypothetical protein
MKTELEYLQYIENELATCQYGEGVGVNLHILKNDVAKRRELVKNLGVIGDVIKRSVIEINYDGHLKAQIETTDLQPKVLKALNGYGQPVDVKGVIISDPID